MNLVKAGLYNSMIAFNLAGVMASMAPICWSVPALHLILHANLKWQVMSGANRG